MNAVIHNAKIKAIKYSKTVLIRYHIVFTDNRYYYVNLHYFQYVQYVM